MSWIDTESHDIYARVRDVSRESRVARAQTYIRQLYSSPIQRSSSWRWGEP